MTDKREPDLFFDKLVALIRTWKRILIGQYNISQEELDSITLIGEYEDDD